MIWGMTLCPGELWTRRVERKEYLSIASLECRPSKNNGETNPSSSLVMKIENRDHVICTLEKGLANQQKLDLILHESQLLIVSAEGTGIIYLTGYSENEEVNQNVSVMLDESSAFRIKNEPEFTVDNPTVGSLPTISTNLVDEGTSNDIGETEMSGVATDSGLSSTRSTSLINEEGSSGVGEMGGTETSGSDMCWTETDSGLSTRSTSLLNEEGSSGVSGTETGETEPSDSDLCWTEIEVNPAVIVTNEIGFDLDTAEDAFPDQTMLVEKLLQGILRGEVDKDIDDSSDEDDYDDGDNDIDDEDWTTDTVAGSNVVDAETMSGKAPENVDDLESSDRNLDQSTDEQPAQTISSKSIKLENSSDVEDEGLTDQSTGTRSPVASMKRRKLTAIVKDHNGSYDKNKAARSRQSRSLAVGGLSRGSIHIPFVDASKHVAGTCRIWDKYSYCLYCSKRQLKLVRHLRGKHRDEELVMKAIGEEEGGKSPLSCQIWRKIRNLGNHEHNKKVHLGKANDLIVNRRPERGHARSIYDYVPCSDCLGYFYTQSLWLHKRTCSERDRTQTRRNHAREGRSLLPLKHDISNRLKKVVDKLVLDEITLIAKNDKDILSVAEKELETSNSVTKDVSARYKMRILGRVVSIGRSLNNAIVCGEDLVKPNSFDTMVKVVQIMSGYDAKTKKHKSTTAARNVGVVLRDLALVVCRRFDEMGLSEKSAEVEEFLELKDRDWSKAISSALQLGDKFSWHSTQILPFTEDCIKFNGLLSEEEMRIKAAVLKEGQVSSQNYLLFAEVLLAQVIFFNRCSPGEVESLEVSDYLRQTTEKMPVSDEIKQSLTVPENVALDRLTLLTVRGEGERSVPILLTDDMKENLDMIVNFHQEREECPKYVFSMISEDAPTPLRGHPLVQKFAVQAELKHPEDMNCPKLCKQIATVSQLMRLRENELEQLATCMGHDIQVHREYYRLPRETLLLAKMMKLLGIAERGELDKTEGKSLVEIEVTPGEPLKFDLPSDSVESHDGDEKEERRSMKVKKKTKARKYEKWSPAEEKFLFSQLDIKQLVRRRRAPGRYVAELVIRRSKGLLCDKTWKDVKYKVYNQNKKKKLKSR